MGIAVLRTIPGWGRRIFYGYFDEGVLFTSNLQDVVTLDYYSPRVDFPKFIVLLVAGHVLDTIT